MRTTLRITNTHYQRNTPGTTPTTNSTVFVNIGPAFTINVKKRLIGNCTDLFLPSLLRILIRSAKCIDVAAYFQFKTSVSAASTGSVRVVVTDPNAVVRLTSTAVTFTNTVAAQIAIAVLGIGFDLDGIWTLQLQASNSVGGATTTNLDFTVPPTLITGDHFIYPLFPEYKDQLMISAIGSANVISQIPGSPVVSDFANNIPLNGVGIAIPWIATEMEYLIDFSNSGTAFNNATIQAYDILTSIPGVALFNAQPRNARVPGANGENFQNGMPSGIRLQFNTGAVLASLALQEAIYVIELPIDIADFENVSQHFPLLSQLQSQ